MLVFNDQFKHKAEWGLKKARGPSTEFWRLLGTRASLPWPLSFPRLFLAPWSIWVAIERLLSELFCSWPSPSLCKSQAPTPTATDRDGECHRPVQGFMANRRG